MLQPAQIGGGGSCAAASPLRSARHRGHDGASFACRCALRACERHHGQNACPQCSGCGFPSGVHKQIAQQEASSDASCDILHDYFAADFSRKEPMPRGWSSRLGGIAYSAFRKWWSLPPRKKILVLRGGHGKSGFHKWDLSVGTGRKPPLSHGLCHRLGRPPMGRVRGMGGWAPGPRMVAFLESLSFRLRLLGLPR